MAPSPVLPGLFCVASLRCPKRRPEKYAAVSAVHTTSSTASNKNGDFCKKTAASHAGISTIQPAAPSDSAHFTRQPRCNHSGIRMVQNTSATENNRRENAATVPAGCSLANARMIAAQLPNTTTMNATRRRLLYPARSAHSSAASAIGTHSSNCQARLGSMNAHPIKRTNSTMAVSMRCLSIDAAADELAAVRLAGIPTGLTQRIGMRNAADELLAGATESALAVAVGLNGDAQRLSIEIGPKFFGKIKFGIRKLPKQEIADALFTAGTNEQVRFGSVIHRQMRGQMCLS